MTPEPIREPTMAELLKEWDIEMGVTEDFRPIHAGLWKVIQDMPHRLIGEFRIPYYAQIIVPGVAHSELCERCRLAAILGIPGDRQ